MKKEYDFKDSKPNPYAKRLKKQITIRIAEATIQNYNNLKLLKTPLLSPSRLCKINCQINSPEF